MPDFSQMTTEQFETWKADNAPSFAGVRVDAEAKHQADLKDLEEKFENVKTSPPSTPQDYDATEKEWLTGDVGYDYTLPSGKHCRLRDLPIEDLAAQGILDRMTRLSGITQKLIDTSQGLPPGKPLEDTRAITELLEVLNIVTPMIVVQPKVWPVPPQGEERKADRIYPESIGLTDRIAILNRSAGGVMKFDNFRG